MGIIAKKLRQQCPKQTTMAVIINNKKIVAIGTNWVNIVKEACPRQGMESGKGYELCKNTCKQPYHAEIDACLQAGKKAEGATLYLIGHTYCCDNCIQIMKAHKISEVVLCESGDKLNLT